MKKLLLAIFAITTLQISLAQDEKDALRKAAKYYKNLDYMEAITAITTTLIINRRISGMPNSLQVKMPKGNLLTSSPNIITAMHKLLKVKASMKSLTK